MGIVYTCDECGCQLGSVDPDADDEHFDLSGDPGIPDHWSLTVNWMFHSDDREKFRAMDRAGEKRHYNKSMILCNDCKPIVETAILKEVMKQDGVAS